MRVTFVLPYASLAGGIRVVAIYASYLQRQGHEVLVVSTPRQSVPLRGKLSSLAKGKGWPRTYPIGPSHLDGTGVEHRRIERFRPITDADVPDADVVIATWWETAEWVAALSPSKGAKVHFVQHDETHQNQPIKRVEATWSLPTHKIVVARWLEELGRGRYGCEDITLVNNGVDLEQFNAPPRGKQRRPTMGMMYSMTRFKGVDLALDAFALAARNIPGLRLVCFGEYPPRAELPLPPETEYHQNPRQDLMKQIYGKCDAWLFASRSEGFGLPILEAMGCRTPVIGTPTGAAPELIAEGGGVLVKPEDPHDMACAIERISRLHDGPWRELSDKAYQTAQKHSWDDAARLFELTLQRVATRERTPAAC
jgi:glycosyltransferase involved in cell wall biosynthesis